MVSLEGLLSGVNAFAKKTADAIADISTSLKVWYQLRGLRSFIKAGIPAVSLAVVPVYGSMIAGCGEEPPCDTSADCGLERYCSPEGVCVGSGYDGLPTTEDDMPIVFSRGADSAPFRLMVTSIDGSLEQEISTGQEDHRSPAWSPDGTRIVFYNNDGLYVVSRINGSATKILGDTEDIDVSSKAIWCGDYIFFQANVGYSYVIMRINSNGTGIHQLTFPDPAHDFYSPSCSNDGQMVAYVSYDFTNGTKHISLSPITGDNGRMVPNTDGADAVYFSNNGQILGFSKTVGMGVNRIDSFYTISLDGSGLQEVAALGNFYRLHSFDWSPDDQHLIFSAETKDGARDDLAPELFLLDLAAGNISRLTDNQERDHSPNWKL